MKQENKFIIKRKKVAQSLGGDRESLNCISLSRCRNTKVSHESYLSILDFGVFLVDKNLWINTLLDIHEGICLSSFFKDVRI